MNRSSLFLLRASFLGILLLFLVPVFPESSLGDPPPPANVTLDQENPPETEQPESTSRLIYFPSQDVFTPLLADPRQPTTTVEFMGPSNTPSYIPFNGNMGGDLGILRWESTANGVNESLQVGVMGGIFSRFGMFGANTYLIDADFVVGIPVTARIGKFSERLFFYHESSHTGYNYTVMNNISKVSDFGQEILQEVSSYDLNPYIRLYGGIAYRVIGLSYYPTFSDSLILLGGFEAYSTPLHELFGDMGRAYIAGYFESRGINGYNLNEDLQVGLLFHRTGSYFQIRPMLDFYNGNSYLGDLLFTKDQYLAAGISFDF